MNLFRMSARSAVIASAVAIGAATLATAPAAIAQDCPDVDVVFARGTGEPDGIGRMGQAMIDALRPQIGGQTLTTYAVNYPASYDFLEAQAGADDATAHITSMVAQCPSTKIVLGGFSQGAAVVDMLAGIPPLGKKIGEIGSGAPLAPELDSKVAAVAVFGNPAAKFGNPLTSSVFSDRAIDLCKDGDPICSNGRNPFAHSDYASAGFTDQAANFVAGRV